jgi:hypothetical protein
LSFEILAASSSTGLMYAAWPKSVPSYKIYFGRSIWWIKWSFTIQKTARKPSECCAYCCLDDWPHLRLIVANLPAKTKSSKVFVQSRRIQLKVQRLRVTRPFVIWSSCQLDFKMIWVKGRCCGFEVVATIFLGTASAAMRDSEVKNLLNRRCFV